MIFYCNVSGTAQVVAKELAQYFKIEYINIDSIFKISEDLLILLVPVLGEEELNHNWLSFLQKSKSVFNEKNIIVFSFGVYDEFVDSDSVFVKQINFILGLSCNDINFYPLKISRYTSNLDLIKQYITEYHVLEQSQIDFKKNIMKLESKAKCTVLLNNKENLDLTSSYNGFTNLLDEWGGDERFLILESLLSLGSSISFTCNRMDLENFKFDNLCSSLQKIYFKSCHILDTPNLQGFKKLDIINFSANLISVLDFFKFPTRLKRINFSKNKIHSLNVEQGFSYENLESLALFNNKITNFSWLSNMKNLKYLNLGMNPIKVFPRELLELINLEY
ncbi:MAG: leucine-rich repeat domain-containing protein, partial [Pseudomonadales bacterium]|nr:leucine-rich repeat domain-containing protein [Pseudomonadales bacterium]